MRLRRGREQHGPGVFSLLVRTVLALAALTLALVAAAAVLGSTRDSNRRILAVARRAHTLTAATTGRVLSQRPSVAVYTANILGTDEERRLNPNSKDISIKGQGPYWAEFMLISRLYNPHLRLVAMVDRPEVLEAHPAVAQALRQAQVEVLPIAPLQANGSRAAQLMEGAPQYFSRYWQHSPNMADGKRRPCLGHTDDLHCNAYLSFRMALLARFCWQADQALKDGVDWAVTMDADVMLTDDLLREFQELMESVDLVTVWEWSSHFVIWKAAALSDCCDAMLEHVSMPQMRQAEVFKTAELFIPQDDWNDALFLSAYLRALRPQRSRVVLCGTPATVGYTRCTRLKWAMALGPREIPGNLGCSNMTGLMEWRHSAGIDPPQAWTKWTHLNVTHWSQSTGPPERIPVLHWLGPICKGVGRQAFLEQFVQRGILPDLQTAAARQAREARLAQLRAWQESAAPLPSSLQAAVAAAAGNASALAALIARPSGLHGRLKKAGDAMPAVLRRGLSLYSYQSGVAQKPEEYPQEINDWLGMLETYNSTLSSSGARPDRKPMELLRSPVPTCLYLVDHTYRVIYARTTKTAGTAVSKAFGLVPVGLPPHVCKLDPEDCRKKYCQGTHLCLTRTIETTELNAIWHNYTVFGVARNPWARAASSWAYSNLRFLANTSCIAPFESFAALPSAYVLPCMSQPGVEWRHALNHIEAQGECLFTADGRPAVDFLARTENLDEDVEDLVRLINERRPRGVPKMPTTDVPKLNVNQAAARSGSALDRAKEFAALYLGGNSTALQDITAYYADDIVLMQFVPGNTARPASSSGKKLGKVDTARAAADATVR